MEKYEHKSRKRHKSLPSKIILCKNIELLSKVSHIYKHTQMSDCQQIVKMLISIRQNA